MAGRPVWPGMLLPFMGQRRSAKLKEAIEAVSLLQESTRARSKHK